MQVLDSRGGVVRDVPVTAFNPATGTWAAAGYEDDGLPRPERVPLEDLAAELGQSADEVAALIMARRPGLIVQDWGGRAWVPAEILENVRKSKRDQAAAAAIPVDREGGDDA